MPGFHAGLGEGFGGRQTVEVVEEEHHLIIHALVLAVRTYGVLGCSPQMIDRIELRRSERQPDQLDSQYLGKRLRSLGGVAAVAVENQRHVPSAVATANDAQ